MAVFVKSPVVDLSPKRSMHAGSAFSENPVMLGIEE